MFGFRRNKDQEIWINVTNRTIVRVLLWIMAAFIAVVAVHKASHAIILILTAFFLALALNAPVHWLAVNLPGRRRGNRTVATLVSFLIVIILLAGFLYMIVPSLVRDTHSFVQGVPHLVQVARDKSSSFNNFVAKHNLQGQVNSITHEVESKLHNVAGPAVSTVSTVASSAISALVVVAMTFMMLIEGPFWFNRVHQLMPKEHSKHVQRLADDMYKVVRGYVNGQVLLAAIAAAFITPMLFILHISSPLALMVLVFMAALIPLFGHTIGAAIVTLVALFHSPWSALIILIYYILYMQFENYVIQPKIQSNTTNLTPLMVFVSVVVGVSFAGIFGGLVAIPVAGCIRVLVVDYLHNHHKLVTESATAPPDAPDVEKK